MWIFLVIVLLVIVIYIIQKKQYEQTEYYQQTQNPFMSVQFNSLSSLMQADVSLHRLLPSVSISRQSVPPLPR